MKTISSQRIKTTNCFHFLEISKVLLATGYPYYGQTEIIDLQSSNGFCENEPSFFKEIWGATGALIGGKKPLICGGFKEDTKEYVNHCYRLKWNGIERKSWWVFFTEMSTKRLFAASIESNGSRLWILGGITDGNVHLDSTEYIMFDGKITQGKDMPLALFGHTIVALDEHDFEHDFLIIGGHTNAYGSVSQDTFYYSSDGNGTWVDGPVLNEGRWNHVAGIGVDDLSNNYIAVVGGLKGGILLDSVEILWQNEAAWHKLGI